MAAKYQKFKKAMDQVSFWYWFSIMAICALVSLMFSGIAYVAFQAIYLFATQTLDGQIYPIWILNIDFPIIFGFIFFNCVYKGIEFIYLAHTEEPPAKK